LPACSHWPFSLAPDRRLPLPKRCCDIVILFSIVLSFLYNAVLHVFFGEMAAHFIR